MFIDKKLNQHFNNNSKSKFVSRVFALCRSSSFDDIKISNSPVSDDALEFAIEAMTEHVKKRTGKVYVAINTLHPDRVKIGRTSKEISDREKSLNSAGVIGKMDIVWFDYSIDCVLTETFIHQRIKEKHIEKEFFKLDIVSASEIVKECTDMTYDFYNKIKRTYDDF